MVYLFDRYVFVKFNVKVISVYNVCSIQNDVSF